MWSKLAPRLTRAYGRSMISTQMHYQRRQFNSLSLLWHPMVQSTSSKDTTSRATNQAPFAGKRCNFATATTPLTTTTGLHPLDPLTAEEIKATSVAVKESFVSTREDIDPSSIRFISVSLCEPKKEYLLSATNDVGRKAEVVTLIDGICFELTVDLSNDDNAKVIDCTELPAGIQPMFSPDDCDLAEEIAKSSPEVQKAVLERYGIKDVEKELVCDPWSVHLADENDSKLTFDEETGRPRRLIQTFLYQRMLNIDTLEDNHYAHPIDIVPVVDLNTGKIVRIDGLDRPPPTIPELSVNYHPNLLSTNSYLQTKWRDDKLRELNVVQPDGPSFEVDGNYVEWQGWTFRVGFNYREGLVLHDLQYQGRNVVHRASLVEMAVPYGDSHPPFQRKCAFDVGDYGLGYCANSLELGCDCLGHIYYFDAVLSDSKGEPVKKNKVVCMHEEDDGLLWKHVEYRNGHNESRRGRELIISSIATVVNYEYLFYWKLKQDGTIDFEIKLSGELSTNLLSHDEEKNGGKPTHGTIVAPGVNAQIHQHMFCARLDMAVDGHKNTVSEVDIVSQPDVSHYGNAFGATEKVLSTEQEAIRTYDATKSRSWKISNAEGKTNPVNGKPTAYKLVPFTKGSAGPTVLTAPTSTVSSKGEFATANLWVTPHDEKERYPAGEYTPQGDGSVGLPQWTANNRSIKGEDVILWHAFGVTHMPRVEDFPVMPSETTGFMLKPDGFFTGNPAIDLPPSKNEASKLASDESCCS